MSKSCSICKIQKATKPEIQKKLAPFVFKHLYNGITEDDVLSVVGSTVIHRGVPLSQQQKNSIIISAENLKTNDALAAIITDLKFTANKKMYHDSVSVEDLLAGKMALWVIDLLEKKIVNLSNLR